jgi:hypothetical protein
MGPPIPLGIIGERRLFLKKKNGGYVVGVRSENAEKKMPWHRDQLQARFSNQ